MCSRFGFDHARGELRAEGRQGIPLAVQLSAANAHDSTYLECTVDAIPPIFGPPGKPGRPRFRPEKLHADKGYDYPEKRRALRRRGITPRIRRTLARRVDLATLALSGHGMRRLGG